MATPILNPTDTNLKLQLQRVMKASPQRVFDAFTKPELLQQWFGPGNTTVLKAEADLRIGGSYRIEMMSSPGSSGESHEVVASGVYQAIVPNELLTFTWHGNWEPGEETLVTVEFKGVAGGTEVTLTHERFMMERSMAGHQRGWQSSFEKLAALFQN